MSLINNSDKASPNDLNLLQNTIQSAYKSFPTAQSEILKRTITVKSPNDDLESVIGKLTDIISFIEIVCYKEPVLLYDPFIPNDYSLTGANYEKSHLELINATQAWGITKGDPDILIGIVDTGIREDHEDLEDKIEMILSNYGHQRHGTFVAGCAAADTDNNKGIASIGFNSGIVFSSGMNIYVALQVAQIPGVKVLNLSWHDNQCDTIHTYMEIYEEIRNIHNVLVTAGAGNNPDHCGENGYIYPAAYESVISVTSIGHLNELGYIDPDKGAFNWKDVHERYIGNVSSTHHHNDKVNISAPGYDVYSTWYTSPSSYRSSSGTSFAAPIVAGTAALVFAANPNLSASEVAHIILSTADSSIYDIPENAPYIGLLGTGRLDAFAAVQEAINCIPVTIESNEIWESEYDIFCGILVKQDAVLDIRSDVKLSKNSRILIEKGGKLIINGGKLTNLDNHPWQGIYVEGDRFLPQTFENQGALILQNGAIIENAKDAVMLKGVDDKWAYTGGIIQATDATFRNNWRNVEFMSYQNTNTQGQPIDNISYFTNCTFITDDETLHDTHTANVTMWNVTGVRFTNCTFTDERENIDYYGYRTSRDGIYTKEATFRVWGSEFNHMKFGIHSIATIPNRYFSVYLSDFSSFKGIYFNAKDNVTIMDNTFHVAPGYTYTGGSCGDTYGIYINNSANFKIENNQLFSTSNGATMCGSLGIIARNTGALANEIYRNDLEGFTVGIEAIGQNKGGGFMEGLELKCTRNLENAVDFFVTMDHPYPRPGIRLAQGYSPSPTTETLAGNLFSNNSSILISNFINFVDDIYYFHHNPASESRVVPAIYSDPPKINLYATDLPYFYNESCPKTPLRNPIIKPFVQLQEERTESMALYSETEIILQSHIDDGSTDLMTRQVEMTGDGDAFSTYQYLMQTSPYVSEEVLTTLGAKEEGFNKAMIRDVLVENPQSAKSEDVNLALDNRQDPLPAYMRWQINNGLYHFSEMEVMRHFMAYQKTRHDRALNRILGGIIRNEEGFENAPPVEEILAGVDDIRYQYMLAEWHFGRRDFSQGMKLLGQIEQDYDLSDEALWNAHVDKLGFYNWLSLWDPEEHPGYTGLPEEALQELENYLDATPRIAGKALSLLVLNEAIEYEEPILYPDDVLKSEPAHQQTMPLIPEMDEEFTFRLYPNPSREYITLDWCFDSPQMKGVIEIRNTAGVLLDAVQAGNQCDQQIYPLTQLRSGTYTATLVSGNHIRKSLSFVVIK